MNTNYRLFVLTESAAVILILSAGQHLGRIPLRFANRTLSSVEIQRREITPPDYGCLVSQWDPAQVTALRAGVYNADGSVVGVVRGRLTEQVLQLAGDGLLDALAQGVEGAVDLAAQCAAALRERCWDGDEELADQLQAALGWGATPLLRSLRVDLEELASLLEGDPLCGGGRIDLRSGVCWPYGVGYGEDDEDDDDEDRWLHVAPLGSREGYRDMEGRRRG